MLLQIILVRKSDCCPASTADSWNGNTFCYAANPVFIRLFIARHDSEKANKCGGGSDGPPPQPCESNIGYSLETSDLRL